MKNKAMSAAERQKKRRFFLRECNLKPIYVKGKNGEFDARVRVGLAIERLSKQGKLPEIVLQLLISTAVEVIPPKNNVDRSFVKKIIGEFLEKDDE